MNPAAEKIFTVSQYIAVVNIALSKFKVKVWGEISQVETSAKGHVYFSLKDENKNVLNCACWKYNYQMSGVKLEEGMEVVLSGAGDIYPPSGRFTFKAETISLKGEGALQKAYLELKARLEKEGLFALEKKKPLPLYPQTIGLITSKTGAALGDFLTNLGHFGFKIKFIDSRVEGTEAVKDLIRAIGQFKKEKIEVLVITRGGGSLESLQAFNNENVVKAIALFEKPVIAAIGHERDAPLAQLAADQACSTPTAAAKLISKNWEEGLIKIERSERVILENFQLALTKKQKQIFQLFIFITAKLNQIFVKYEKIKYAVKSGLEKISRQIAHNREAIKEQGRAALNCFNVLAKQSRKELAFLEKTISANSPEKNLSLGYCIAKKKGKVLKSIKKVFLNDHFDLLLKDGIINSQVKNKQKYGRKKQS